MRDAYADHMWSRVIPVDTQFRESSRMGVPINLHDPSARGTETYASLLRWLQAGTAPLARAASQ